MQFTQPLFLFGYFAILIPIIIHLFNFRRYKTYYFSNVKMLQDVVQKTKRESQLKHLIVLLFRILCILALVTAFAQPYIPSSQKETKSANLITIYIDNSFSMEGNTPEGTLFTDAIENAKQIINHFQYSDQFILYNNNFSAKQRSKLNKEEALQELDSWEISPNSRNWNELLAFEENACANSGNFNIFHYYISDFQKNNFDFTQYSHHDGSTSYLIRKPAKEISNVAIDSCWFLSPVFRKGQQATLTVRVRNCSDEEVVKLPLKLHVNGEQKAMTAVDIAPNSTADYQMNFTLGNSGAHSAVLEIEDVPITFDNKLYFAYNVSENTMVTAVYGKEQNRYITALYGKDSVFSFKAFSAGRIDYNQLRNSSLVVLDQLDEISSGLADELKKYLKNGGNVLLFPSATMNPSVNSFLASIDAAQYGKMVSNETKVGTINMESHYFKGSMSKNNGRLDMPTATQYYGFTAFHADESIMSFENQSPLLFVNQVGKGRLFLSAVAMDDAFGNIHKHALFFIPLHNIGIRSLMHQKLYNIIGEDHSQVVNKSLSGSENVFMLKSQNNGTEIIPEQKNLGNETMLYFNERFNEAGLYDVMHDGAKLAAVAFNFDRKESQLNYHDEKELEKAIPEKSRTQVITSDAKDITGQVVQTVRGIPLWRWFILLALFCIVVECGILRLWVRKPKNVA